MKLILRLLIITLTFSGPNAGFAVDCELKTGWEPWPPFQYLDDSGMLTGLDVDLLKAVAERMNCRLLFVQIRWKAHLDRLKNGSLDLGASASRTDERAEFAYFSEPYRQEVVKLFVRKGDAGKYSFKTIESIAASAFILGATEGYYYGADFERLMKTDSFRERVELVEDNINNFHKLDAGRIDGFLMDSVAAVMLHRQLGYSQAIEVHPLEIYSSDIFIIFSKKSVTPVLVQRFNQCLSELQQNGVYGSIVSRYQNQKFIAP